MMYEYSLGRHLRTFERVYFEDTLRQTVISWLSTVW